MSGDNPSVAQNEIGLELSLTQQGREEVAGKSLERALSEMPFRVGNGAIFWGFWVG